MHIAVLVKQVPDTWGTRTIDADTLTVERTGEVVADEIDLRALECALRLKDADRDVDITVVTMGPKQASRALRDCLAMGADRAIHVVDDALAGSDALQTARVLSAALTPGKFDVILAGNESTDGRAGVVPAAIAELLSLPQATNLTRFEVSGDRLTGERLTADGSLGIEAPLPAVVSVTEHIAEARYPGLKGIMTAKRKPVETLDAADLGLEASRLGGAKAASVVSSATPRPPRAPGTIVDDDGTGGTAIADYLASARLI